MSTKRETREQRRARLDERVRTLPTDPGCYLMKGRDGEIFYVGKASNLRARVRSYFSGSDTRQFVGWLDDILDELDVVVVRNEKEALLLERTLVKEHQPRFNVLLRDDKNFIHLRLDLRPAPPDAMLKRKFPRVEVARNPSDDGARYFGPFHSATSVRSTLRTMNRFFQLRTCKDTVLENRVRPCLQHQIGRCPAPCVFDVPDYAERVAEAGMFLGGQTRELEHRLKARMGEASDREDYEVAARLRDQLKAVTTSFDEQVVTEVERRRDQDIYAVERSGALLEIVRLLVRDGRMQGTEHFNFEKQEFPTPELLSSFLTQLYGIVEGTLIPDEVLLSLELPEEDTGALAQLLSERRGKKVGVRVPARGHGIRLLEIAQKNAAVAMADRLRKRETRENGLKALAARLELKEPPRVIECFDISLFQGTDAVASQVCFVDGAPDKSRYRRYNIKTVEGTDDFAMLYEALTRRIKRGREEGDLPDLLIVDGGKGQLNVAMAVCRDLNFPFREAPGGPGFALASIAKARSFRDERPGTPLEANPFIDDDEPAPETIAIQKSPERLFVPGVKDPLILRPHTAERFLIEQLRDEAHRFAITAHRNKRKRRTLTSVLDDIPGVGPAKRKALLTKLGSVKAIQEASIEDIAQVPGIGGAIAKRVKDALGEATLVAKATVNEPEVVEVAELPDPEVLDQALLDEASTDEASTDEASTDGAGTDEAAVEEPSDSSDPLP